MKIIVKLYGTLGQEFPGYNPGEGLSVELPDGARVENLLAHLEIPQKKGCFISMNNTIAKLDDKLTENATIMILQKLAGG
jgi:sulfur carrier protein ThiS